MTPAPGGDAAAATRGAAPRAAAPESVVLDAVAAQGRTIREVIAFIHGHPELAFEEHQCADYLATLLERGGLRVERGVGGMPTAFRATIAGRRPGRAVGLVAVYDAVPSVRPDGTIAPVHSCGHGPQAAGVAGAALALAGLAGQLAGSVVVLGLPADETTAPAAAGRGGGKEISVRAGLWQRIDTALYAHPESIDTVSPGSLWMRQDEAVVVGRRSLRDGSAQAALDAVGAAIARVRAAIPQRLGLERAAFFGSVEEGSQLVLSFRFFAEDEPALDEVAERLRAELPDSTWRVRRVVPSVVADESARAAVAAAMAAAGRDFVADPPRLPHGNDFGFVTRAVPAALIGLGRPEGWAMHADEGAEQFAGPDGEAAGLAIAQVVALASASLSEPG